MRRVLIAAAAAVALAACGEAEVEYFEPDDAIATPRDFTLRGGVMPLLQVELTCTSATCHDADGPASGLDLSGDGDALHAALLAGGSLEAASFGDVVNMASPEGSLLLQLPDSSFQHAHSKYWDSANVDDRYATLKAWIEADALNN